MSLLAAVLSLVLPVLAAAPAPAPKAAKLEPSAEQTADLKALDLEIARFDAVLATVADAQQRASEKAFLDGFKDRRVALRAKFNHDAFVELRWEIDVEYQRMVAWLRPAETPPAPAKKSG